MHKDGDLLAHVGEFRKLMRDGNVKSSAETGLRFRQSLNPFWFQKLSNHPKFHSLLNRNVENIANVLLEVFHAEEAILAHRNSRY